MVFKVDRRVLLWNIIVYLFVFQRALTGISSVFSYMDEVFTIIVIAMIILNSIYRSKIFSRTEILILFLLGIACVIGVMGNISSRVLIKGYPIIVDIISMLKVWIAYYAVVVTSWKVYAYDKLIISLAKTGRLIVWIMLCCLAISQVIDIGMTASARLGIKSFQFIYNVPGNFSKMFYFLIPLLTADLYYKSSKYKKVMIFFALFVWASTMRSRAFAFIAVYLIMALYFFSINGRKWKEEFRKKIKLIYVIPVMLVAVAISWNQLIFYFTTATQARSLLLRYGIMTMITYFPLGAGFGTFGSDIAATHYSPLYSKYGFNAIYGMRQGEEYFLNDNYWPMIMGQFGVIGTLLVFIVVYRFMKMVLQDTKNNKYFYFSTFCAVVFLLLSSIASKSYSEYSSICVFLLIGFVVKRQRKCDIIGEMRDDV